MPVGSYVSQQYKTLMYSIALTQMDRLQANSKLQILDFGLISFSISD